MFRRTSFSAAALAIAAIAGAQGASLAQFNQTVHRLIIEQKGVNDQLTGQLSALAGEKDIKAKINKMIPIYLRFANQNDAIGRKYDLAKAPPQAEPVRKKMAQILHKIATLTRAAVPSMRTKNGKEMQARGNAMTSYANQIPGEMERVAAAAGFDGNKFNQDGVLVPRR